MIRAATVFLFLTLAACTQFPELDDTVTPDLRKADFPELVPLEPVLDGFAPVVADPVETTEALDARVTSLQARAAALQEQDIVDEVTENRLNAARN